MAATPKDAVKLMICIKNAFVRDKLAPIIKAIDSAAKSVEYKAECDRSGNYVVNETVTVSFLGGGTRVINVTGDSCSGIVKDVINKLY